MESIEEGWRKKQRQRSSRLFGGQNLFNSLPRQLFCFGRFGRIVLFNLFFYISTEAKQLARQGIEYILPLNRRDDLCLCFCLHPSSMMESWNPLLPFFRNFAQSSKLFTALNELCSTSSEPVCKDIAHIFIIYFINWNVEGTWDWLVTTYIWQFSTQCC